VARPEPKRVFIKTFPIAVPDVLSRDELAGKSDDELVTRLDSLNSAHSYVKDAEQAGRSPAPLPWEKEIAYAQRELGLRISRRHAHQRYLEKQQGTAAA
jgi:hypothetical protein